MMPARGAAYGVEWMRILRLLVLAAAGGAGAQDGPRWSEVERPSYATITAVEWLPDAMLAGSANGRVFRSTDGGASWTWVLGELLGSYGPDGVNGFLQSGPAVLAWAGSANSPMAVCFPVACPDATVQGGLYRSVDGGRTWARVGPDHGVAAVTRKGRELFLASGGRVMRSTDDGATWKPLAKAGWRDVHLPGIKRLVSVGDALMAAGFMTLARATLSGDSLVWEPVAGSGADLWAVGRALYRRSEGGRPSLLRSLDAGATWRTLAPVGLDDLASAGDSLVGLRNDTLLSSADSGRTWTVFADLRLPSPSNGRRLAVHRGVVHLFGGSMANITVLERGGAAVRGRGLHDYPVGGLQLDGGRLFLGSASMDLRRPDAAWETTTLDTAGEYRLAGMARHGGILYGIGFSGFSSATTLFAAPADPLRPWRKVGLSGQGIAAGSAWMAVLTRERTLFRCTGEVPAGCDSVPTGLPTPQLSPNSVTLSNTYRDMAISGDTLAIALDGSLHLSVDRGRTFRTAGPSYRPYRALAFHEGELLVALDLPASAGSPGLLRLDRGSGDLVPVDLAGVSGAHSVRALDSRNGTLVVATAGGVFARGADGAWRDLLRGIAPQGAHSVAMEGGLLVAGLEDGTVRASPWGGMVGLARGGGGPRVLRGPVPGYPGRYPPSPGAAARPDAWRRLDGRAGGP